MNWRGRDIAVAAIASAIATSAIAIAVWTPLSVLPLVVCVVALLVCRERTGKKVPFGIAIAVSSVLGLVIGGLSLVAIVYIACFVPYTIWCSIIKRLGYNSMRGALVRLVGVLVTSILVTIIALVFWDVITQEYSVYQVLGDGYAGIAIFVALVIGFVALMDIAVVRLYSTVLRTMKVANTTTPNDIDYKDKASFWQDNNPFG